MSHKRAKAMRDVYAFVVTRRNWVRSDTRAERRRSLPSAIAILQFEWESSRPRGRFAKPQNAGKVSAMKARVLGA